MKRFARDRVHELLPFVQKPGSLAGGMTCQHICDMTGYSAAYSYRLLAELIVAGRAQRFEPLHEERQVFGRAGVYFRR